MLPKVLVKQFAARNRRLKRKEISYPQYLKSEKWASIKSWASKQSRFACCTVCGSKVDLVFHHFSYLRMFAPGVKKPARDLLRLCNAHHYEIHNMAKEKELGLKQSVKWLKKSYLSKQKLEQLSTIE